MPHREPLSSASYSSILALSFLRLAASLCLLLYPPFTPISFAGPSHARFLVPLISHLTSSFFFLSFFFVPLSATAWNRTSRRSTIVITYPSRYLSHCQSRAQRLSHACTITSRNTIQMNIYFILHILIAWSRRDCRTIIVLSSQFLMLSDFVIEHPL